MAFQNLGVAEHSLAFTVVWLAAAALTACSQGDQGVLEPMPQDGVELVTTHGLPNDTARLQGGGVTADVIGDWSNQGESVVVQYRTGKVPARLEMQSVSTWKGQTAPATEAWDLSNREPGNGIGRPLLDAGPLQLAAGASKQVQIMFERLGKPNRPSIGDEVTVTIPMPGGAVPTRFRVAGQ